MKTALGWLVAAAALLFSTTAAAQTVRLSEIHYDNTGTDVGEAIEVSGPAGQDLTGWQVILYNGNGGASYDTRTLSGPVPATCGARGVVVLTYPANGIQNGPPDAVALVNGSGAVVEFLSYEGVFAATNGPAAGLTSTDIGVLEAGTEPIGLSLQRAANGTWSGPVASTFGACNDGDSQPPADVASVTVTPASATINVGATSTFTAAAFDISAQPIPGTAFTWTSTNPAVATVNASGVATAVSAGTTSIVATATNGVAGSAALTVNEAPPPPTGDFDINEIHYDNLGTDTGEAIEIEGPAGADITGFQIVLYNGSNNAVYGTQTLSGVLPTSCGTRGVFVVSYPQDGIQNGAPDAIALVNALGEVIDFVSYEGVLTAAGGPANGLTSVDIGVAQTNAALGTSLQRGATGVWASGASTFGACNGDGPVPPGNTLQFSGRVPSDPPLPVGYEDQIFATLRQGTTTIPTTITWVSETPAIASIDANGVMRALAEGTATLRATAADGTTATYSLPTRVAVAGTTAQYANNAEFGEPFDGTPADDYIVRRPQLTSSYNAARGQPNWVAYEFDATHFGSEDRCDCFTMDHELPASFPRIDTNDYTGSGAFHGYGIDRGHLARSFDRTTGSLDNATTFLFTNIIPQAADNNQGPWSQLEFYLGDLARFSDREVYVIAGASGNKGTLKNEGKIVIPTHTWKVALVLPRNQGLADIRDYRDVLEVVAVIMPNEPGIRNVPWETYRTTVDAVEALSGYDLLALLEDGAEAALESGTQPPIAAISGPAGALIEGDSAAFNASSSVDPNGSITSYAWSFGDGTSAEGVSATHTFAQDGTYTVSLTVTDNDGLTDVATFVVTVTNAAPVIGAVPDGTATAGTTYSVSGSFSDPGADSWTATVDWGDGSAAQVVPLAGRTFSLSHTYASAGTFVVTIEIADDDAATADTHTVAVNAATPTLAGALPLIDQLVASGKLPRAVGAVLKAEVIAVQRALDRGNTAAARTLLRAMVVEIDLLVRLRVISAADAAPLRSLLVSVLATI